MALVDYSSSSSSDDEEDEARQLDIKSRRSPGSGAPEPPSTTALPPLPARFHDLYASSARVSTSDDHSLHGGRQRVTPHIQGNWPSHLYVEWFPSAAEHASLSTMVTALGHGLPPGGLSLMHSLLTSDLGAPLPLHISLSRSIGFATERKDDFVVAVDCAIRSSGIRPFDVTISSLDWVPNFERTRWFLVLRVAAPGTDGLNKLLHVSNKVVQEHGQPPLYIKAPSEKSVYEPSPSVRSSSTPIRTEPSADWDGMQDVSDAFHISIAWTLEPPSNYMLDATKSVALNQFDSVRKLLIRVEEIKAKVGNTITSVPLRKNVSEARSLFGV